jgi:hypothetical protein
MILPLEMRSSKNLFLARTVTNEFPQRFKRIGMMVVFAVC